MADEPKKEKAPKAPKKEGAARKEAGASKKEEAPKAAKPVNKADARLRRHYKESVIPALVKEFGYKNVMAVPKIDKVAVNIGLGEATQNAKLMDGAVNELGQIAGQKPVITKAKKSIAAFKLREGMAIGTMVTLRGDRMYEFLDRLMNVALPRVRDFRGVSSKSFDGRGNYTLGVKDQLIFPEIDYNKVEKVKGMNISITTTAKSDAEGLALLKHMGMPFRPASLGENEETIMATTAKIAKEEKPKSRCVKDSRLKIRHAQPVFPMRAAARLSSQVQPVPDLLPEARPGRRDPGRDQGQLVRKGSRANHGHIRSHRRHVDAHSQRADGAPSQGGRAGFQAETRDRADPQGRRLHHQLQDGRRWRQEEHPHLL